MAEDHRNSLWMFVDQKREYVLRVRLVQETKRQGFERLLQQRQHIAGIFAQGFLDQLLARSKPPEFGTRALGLPCRNSVMTRS